MDRRFNTPCRACRGIIAATLIVVAAVAVAAIIGCASLGEHRRQNIAQVIQTAYDLGGREAVSNRIESLVAEGKLSPTQGARLHALAQLAYEGVMDDLKTVSPKRSAVAEGELNAGCGANTNATTDTASQSGCGDCSTPEANGDCGGGGCTDAPSASQGESGAEHAGGCNEDARCGNCADCKAQG